MSSADGTWIEVAERVFARRHTELDLTAGLVVGDEAALLIDTRGDHRQGAELAEAVGRITRAPLRIALTHGHFDHCFGTAAFLPAPVWAHERCPAHLARTADDQREQWVAHYRTTGDTDTADALAASSPTAPDHLVTDRVDLDLGGRTAQLRHFGLGHTDHDLVVAVPDAAVAFAGDLVEQGAPPDFDEAHLDRWPATLDAMLAIGPEIVVPGHGAPVSPEFVRTQRDEIAELARIREEFLAGRITRDEAVHRSPYPADTTSTALSRAF
ncbi:MBL fold metallo-hydrolase [Saccharopolyspora dendranthemae]|uniref:Glyoxylase-like metal-dependent hydrolase (Beta-lactamase superfamily II) n=1 Tax=Saccharopolyspora dendranthemae TaxID=1181886 RepID=A0A561U2R1_9PSEU|nr:MBL fold metallo-hydrolase [Saccharopolyspora dendranthemae]TWF93652.1 glyoxylase-like metal-dependent hydrolase (beta-lactamase superfamily II) [Saccharopolyspora dendranthemae]